MNEEYKNELDKYWDLLVDYGIATQEELELITGINGYNIETLNDVLFYRTGHRDVREYFKWDDDYTGVTTRG